MVTSPDVRRVGVVLYAGFELLDVFGPLEIFGSLPAAFSAVLLGPDAGPLPSAQGPRVLCDHAWTAAPHCDVILVPGGPGARQAVNDASLLAALQTLAASANPVTSVCTGSALLAAAGLLDGYRATSNKRAFAWVRTHGADVTWVPEARWVVDRERWTSSGIAAGIDMALGLVAHLCGPTAAEAVADRVEYEWHRDPAWDPFAAKNGLTG